MADTKGIPLPPFGARLAEIPFLFDHLKDGTVLNIGGATGAWRDAVLKRGHAMTIVDCVPINYERAMCENIQADIRQLEVEDIGKYDNIILMSTLEHIGVEMFPADVVEDGIIEAQLEVFRHCMKFLRPGGHMIFTVPCGSPVEKPKHKLLYSKEMIEDIKGDYDIVTEEYGFSEDKGLKTWEIALEFPDNPDLHQDPRALSDLTNRYTRVVCMMVLTNKE